MTLADIARFVEHPSARLYLAVCDRFGLDPGRFIEDPHLAFQLDLALWWRYRPVLNDQGQEMSEQERELTQRVKEAMQHG